MEGLRTSDKSPALTYGGAIHKALECRALKAEKAYVQEVVTEDWPKTPVPDDEYRTIDRCMKDIDFLWDKTEPFSYETKLSLDPILETHFEQHWFSYADYDIYIQGYFDAIIQYAGNLAVLDRKTTSDVRTEGSGVSIGTRFWKSIKPNLQFEIYLIAASTMYPGHTFKNFMIQAIGIGKPLKTKPDALRTCVEYMPISWTKEELKETEKDILSHVIHFIDLKENGYFPKQTKACHDYNYPCPYLDLCTTAPHLRENMKSAYIKEEPRFND